MACPIGKGIKFSIQNRNFDIEMTILLPIPLQLLERFQKMGLCLSYSTRNNILEHIGGHFQDSVIEAVKKRQKTRTVGDSWNLRILKRDMRQDAQNVNYNWFQFAIMINRINLDHLPATGHVGNIQRPDLTVFLPNDNETAMLRENYKVLAARVIIEFLGKFKFLDSVIPIHIPHPYQGQMAEKSVVIPMPMLQKDEKSYNDMVDILDQGEKWIREIYHKAGVIQDV